MRTMVVTARELIILIVQCFAVTSSSKVLAFFLRLGQKETGDRLPIAAVY